MIRINDLLELDATPAQLGLDDVANPYDPAVVRVDVALTFPDGASRVLPAFWYVPMEPYYVAGATEDNRHTTEWERFRATGDGSWRGRFAPQVEGEYAWRWTVTRGGETRDVPGGSFRAAAPPVGPGRVVLRDGERYFRRADGSPFYPIGENLGWPEEPGSRIYGLWLRRLSEAGGNAARLWLVHYMCGTALEWSPKDVNPGYAGVGRYSQESGARVDRFLDEAGRNGICIMLSFFSFGDTNWDWKNNPYSVYAGGWLDDPRTFFSDERARRAVKARLRYAVARYGWSSNVWAWELWNEVESSRAYEEDAVTQWHREMAAYLKEIDVHRHLVTTSYRFTPPSTPCAAYAMDTIDFVNVHTYLPDIARVFPYRIRSVESFGKPVVVSEFGLDVSPTYFPADPDGLHVHDGLWAGVFAGSAGGGMTWWWERYIHPRDLYNTFTGLSHFMRDRDMTGLVPVASEVAGDAAGVEAKYFSLALAAPGRVLAWTGIRRTILRSLPEQGGNVVRYGVARESGPVTLRVACAQRGEYDVAYYDTFCGEVVTDGTAECDGATLTVQLPAMKDDVAVECMLAAPTPGR